MKYINALESPVRIFGLPGIRECGEYARASSDLYGKVSAAVDASIGKAVGGRVRFRTNSEKIFIKIELKTLNVDFCIPLCGSAGADVYTGDGVFLGVVCPTNYRDKVSERCFVKPAGTEDIIINLPRNEAVQSVTIGIEDGAEIYEPTPYTISKPIVFYGSSITEGGCASRVGNCYTALLSRWLDADYINLGFSGNARGEAEMAEYIAKLEMSAFVMDYDHNTYKPQELERTHEPFFKIIRKSNPELPVIMMSRPGFKEDTPDAPQRRDIVRRTYENAVNSGDKNVYFIGGEELFGENERCSCTVDNVHPNDLGFMRMAERIYRTMKNIQLRQE